MINWKVAVLPLAIILSTVLQIGAQDWQGDEWLATDLSEYGNENGIAQDVSKSMNGDEITFVGGSALVGCQTPVADVVELSTASNAGLINPLLRASGGHLSLRLIDDTIKTVDMNLYQNGELIFGCGTMVPGSENQASVVDDDAPKRDEGIKSMIWWLEQEPAPLGSSSQVAASGLLIGNVVDMDLISLDDRVLYKLHLTIGEDALWGSYNAYDYRGSAWIGSAEGTIS